MLFDEVDVKMKKMDSVDSFIIFSVIVDVEILLANILILEKINEISVFLALTSLVSFGVGWMLKNFFNG